MSLQLYIAGDKLPEDIEVVRDVEREFLHMGIVDSESIRKILAQMEQAEYIDKQFFKDRFGSKLHGSELSTGCKAAICVEAEPDKIIDTVECGRNAVAAIVKYCTHGKILYIDDGITIRHINGLQDDVVDVILDQYKFTSLTRLNEYISSERPFAPRMTGGIEYVL